MEYFIDLLNHLVPDLYARFPTEAEWEYACRAGSTTPFSFGTNITPEQVNYSGDIPYADGVQGRYRKKTVPVASLPPNAWGLYEMHGNVMEWCADWYKLYPSEPQTDPQGPPSAAFRVFRGGSWVDMGKDVRSAYRGASRPGKRHRFVGFRLAADGENKG